MEVGWLQRALAALTLQKAPVSTVQEAGWAQGEYGREWRGENLWLPRGSNTELSSS